MPLECSDALIGDSRSSAISCDLWSSKIRNLLRLSPLRGLLALLDFTYDFWLWFSSAGCQYRAPRSPEEAEFSLWYYVHRVEKSLLLGETAAGQQRLWNRIAESLQYWLRRPGRGGCRLTLSLSASLKQSVKRLYTPFRPGQDNQESLQLRELLDQLSRLQTDDDPDISSIQGGLVYHQRLPQDIDLANHFHALAHRRRSVRSFAEGCVPIEVIEECVRIAQQSPSACNRQAVRVHVFSDRESKLAILRYQNGNQGFGLKADKLLMLTYDLRAVLSSSERNLPFLDVGLFAMSLLYALEARNVATCCLNLNNYAFRDRALRRVSSIPPTERPVLLIAMGQFPESFATPASIRIPLRSVLRFH